MIPDPSDPGLSSTLPAIRRAREYRLYGADGRRYLDFWQVDGHAILGHRGAATSRAAKDVLSRGLLQDLPTPWAGRFARALAETIPSHPHVRVFGSLLGCLRALSAWQGSEVRVADLADLDDPGSTGGAIALWRPLAPPPTDAVRSRALVPVLPVAVSGGPWAVCFGEPPGPGFPPSEPISAVVLEAAARGLRALRRYVPGALPAAIERLGRACWEVRGVYLLPRFDRAAYRDVFSAFLRQGVVLSPRYDCPSIIPPLVSAGERARAVGLFRSNPAQ